VIRGGTNPEYVQTSAQSGEAGFVLYASGSALRAVRFDPERLQVLAVGGAGNFEERSLAWVDRRGAEQPINAPRRAYTYPRISPDGTRVALAIADQEQDIWVLDLAHLTLGRLTFGPAIESNPVWTPDGRRLMYSSSRAGIPSVFWQPADNTGAAEQLTNTTTTLVTPFSVSPDGKTAVVGLAGGIDLGLLRLDGGTEPTPLVQDSGSQANADISPDGRWLAYQSNESGQMQVYVRPFPEVNAGRWQITTDGGGRPVWARSGRELFYMVQLPGGEAEIMSVPIDAASMFRYGNPTRLFAGRYGSAGQPGRIFDVWSDGQKFLVIKSAQVVAVREATPPSMIIVLNWFEELRARVPTR
jgi:eukaryotic-like serine/threonine-protein kinase